MSKFDWPKLSFRQKINSFKEFFHFMEYLMEISLKEFRQKKNFQEIKVLSKKSVKRTRTQFFCVCPKSNLTWAVTLTQYQLF